MFMRRIYDESLAQAAYLIGCQATGEAIVFDPERDVERYLRVAAANDLKIVAVAETHIHADFLSGARELAERAGAKVYLSDEGGAEWRYGWLDQKLDGGSYDHQLLYDGDVFAVGNIEFEVLHTPGHTPEHLSFLVTDRGGGATAPIGLISGDFLFVGDLGRPDLLETAAGQQGTMEDSARQLHASIARLEGLPDYLQVWPAHGAGSACGKSLGGVPTSTLGYERRFNVALQAAGDEQQFVDYILAGQPEPPLYFARMKRDNKLGPAVIGTRPQPPRLSAAEFAGLDPRQAAVIDTRIWPAFRERHVAGSLSIPVNRSFSTHAGSFVAEGEPIYLVTTQSELDTAIVELQRIGYDQILGWFPVNDLELAEAEGCALTQAPEVAAGAAAAMFDNDGMQFLDVRRAAEFAADHYPDAINISHTRLAARLDELPRDRLLVVYCRTGDRSARACTYLRRQGHDVVNLGGGIEARNRALVTRQ